MLEIKRSEKLHNNIADKIFSELKEYNDQHSPKVNYKKVVFHAEENGDFLGGIEGCIAWDNFEISNMIVLKRNQGIGTQLIKKTEEYAREHGATKITVWTLDFQAPEFYQKCGFKTFAVVPNFAGKHSCHHLIKRLD